MRTVDATDRAVLLAPETDAEADTLADVLAAVEAPAGLLGYHMDADGDEEHDRVVLAKSCADCGGCGSASASPSTAPTVAPVSSLLGTLKRWLLLAAEVFVAAAAGYGAGALVTEALALLAEHVDLRPLRALRALAPPRA